MASFTSMNGRGGHYGIRNTGKRKNIGQDSRGHDERPTTGTEASVSTLVQLRKTTALTSPRSYSHSSELFWRSQSPGGRAGREAVREDCTPRKSGVGLWYSLLRGILAWVVERRRVVKLACMATENNDEHILHDLRLLAVLCYHPLPSAQCVDRCFNKV